jgi:hypothetical protein
LGLPVVSAEAPAGGKGIVHTQTLFKEGIDDKLSVVMLVL